MARALSATSFNLKYGSTTLPFEVPAENFAGALSAQEAPGLPDEGAAIAAALRSPLGSPRLGERLRPGQRVVVVVSDVTRPSPSATLLPPLLDELAAAGVRDSDVTVVFALGTHRPHSREEQIRLVGEKVFERVRCVDFDPTDCVEVGVTSRGTVVRASRLVVESDLRICTGNVEYHWFAGYSGGGKALVPGVCTRETVEHNHKMMLQPGAHAGSLAGNPVREDIDEAAALIGADFALNAVLNSKRQIVRAIAGDARAVLLEGKRVVDEMNGVALDEPADIVVASPGGYPKDLNLYQAQKGLDNARLAVRQGGIIILVAECREGLGEATFSRWMESAAKPADLVERLRREFVIGGHKAAALGATLVHSEIYLVSSFSEEYARRVFFTPVSSPQEALARALERLGPASRVLVMPNAGSTLPLLH